MKIVLSLLIFLNFSFAFGIKSMEILKDDPSLNFENIKTNKNFKRIKPPLLRHTKDNYWLKIVIDKKKLLKEKEYILRINPRLGMNELSYDKTLKRDFINSDIIKIDQNNIEDIYIKIHNDMGVISLSAQIYEKNIYQAAFSLKNIIFGISYGIIIAAFLYYLAFYIFNREKSFIYYALTQLFLLLMIFSLIDDNDIFILGFLIFSNLFTKEFLNTKKHAPFLDKILTAIIFIYIFEQFTELLSEFFPTSIFLIFYLIAAVVVYIRTRFKPILFYIAGWSIVIFAFIFIEFQFYFIEMVDDSLELNVFAHIVAPLESLILAFALSYKMKLLEESKMESERMLIHQNKLAAMGEMISNIAHQWRQPLTHISYILMNINTAFKHKKLDEKYLNKKTSEATKQLEYMSNTIDDFKDFYSPKKDIEEFYIKEAVQNALTIISSNLESNNISLTVKGEDHPIKGYKSELSQVVLNLITNAKDALIQNNITDPKIEVIIEENRIIINDNGGGIDEKIKEKIFDPYFTTKDQGSGIGLYMSKMILMTHFNGELNHENIDKGSSFIISLKTISLP